MSKKQDHRKKRASEKVFEKAEKHEGTSGEALKHERSSEKVEKLRLHGVITEGQLGEQINRSGLYPFTFKSSLLLLLSALFGGVVLPFLVGSVGGDARLTVLLALPVLLSAALSFSRYFLDSQRGCTGGFWLTLAVSFALSFVIVYCALYRGLLI